MWGLYFMECKSEREVAADILTEIFTNASYGSLALRKGLSESGLNRQQKAFVTEVVGGVLRNLYLLDNMIDTVSNTKTKRMRPFVLASLRAAAYQIKFMNNGQNYAICNETVKIIKRRGYSPLAGFVNAVIRALIAKDEFLLPNEKTEPDLFLSVCFSVPLWLVRRFIASFGYEKTKQMCEINNTPPTVSIYANTLKVQMTELAEKLTACGVSVSAGNLPFCANLTRTCDIISLKPFADGEFFVIDESAVRAVYALDPKPDECVLDICAAPGGKTFLSAILMQGKGTITATDIHPHKIKLINSGAKRLGLQNIKTFAADATIENENFFGKFDKVLVDAPCSGFGVLRKKPDIKLTKTEQSIDVLSDLQRKILSNAAKYVKKGGSLVYSTCTVTPEENTENVKWFEDKFSFVKTAEQTILPQDYNSDGFFIAAFEKL
jgi:16S rRNA (cytosine967-C5)-methyltransferase